MTYNKKKETRLDVGCIYSIDGIEYLIDEKTYNKIYGYLVDENREPWGRRRIMGLKNKEVIKIELSQ